MLSAVTDAPDLRAHCHGLVESANVVTRSGGRWENGIQFSPLGCYPINGMEADCPPIGPKELSECEPVTQFRPYVLTAGLDWSAASGDDAVEIARQTLEAGTSAQLEEFLWSGATEGDGPRNPYLMLGALAGLASSALRAVGLIESALLASPTGGAGTVYMSPVTASRAADALVERDGRLYTKTTCSLVVVGNFARSEGFDIVAGHVGEIDVYLSEIVITDTRDEYRRNDYVVMAERLAIAAFNPCEVYVAGYVELDDEEQPPDDEGITSLTGELNIIVDNTDPDNPVVEAPDVAPLAVLVEDLADDLGV